MSKKAKEEVQVSQEPVSGAEPVETPLETLFIPKGTFVGVNGYSFQLCLDTKVKGLSANLAKALEGGK